MAAVASSGADSFITEGQAEEEVAHGLVGVPYHLALFRNEAFKGATNDVGQDHHQNVSSRIKRSLGSAQGAISGPPTCPVRPEEVMIFALGSRVVVR